MRASSRENDGRMDEGIIDCSGAVVEAVGGLVGDDGELLGGFDEEQVSDADEAVVGEEWPVGKRNGRRLYCFFVALVNRAHGFVMGN